MEQIERFDNWNILKQNIEKKDIKINIKEKNIYFLSLGQNIGTESYGKGDSFLRPVIVYKKLGSNYFLGIPLTSKIKDGSYYFTFNRKNGKKNSAMLNQMKTFDAKRVISYGGKISNNTFSSLQLKLEKFLDITLTRSEGVPTRAKSKRIISNNTINVNNSMDGVILTPLKQIHNPKGDVFHAMKKSDEGFDGFGEAYFSTVQKNDIKGWKKHTKMTLNLVVPLGEIEFIVYDDKKNEFFSVKLSQNNYQRLTVKQNLWMAFRGVDENNMLLNLASIEHDPQEAINLELDKIKYDW